MTEPKQQFDVFLCHHSIDKPWVIRFKETLEQKGLRVWLDKDEIRPGDLFAKALENGISSSRAVAIIVSPESLASSWVEEEYYRALSLATSKRHNLRLIPVLLRRANLPGFLSSRHWIECHEGVTLDHVAQQLIWGISGRKLTYLSTGEASQITSLRWYAAIAAPCAIIALSLLNTFTSLLSGLSNFRLRFAFVNVLLIVAAYLAYRIWVGRCSRDSNLASTSRSEYTYARSDRRLAAAGLIATAATLLLSGFGLRHFSGREGALQGRVVGQDGAPAADVRIDAVNVDGISVCRAPEATDSVGRLCSISSRLTACRLTFTYNHRNAGP